MGVGEQSVLDPATMKVRGLEGIRVVDASSMPYVTNGNIYAPVVMLSEKASDLIRGYTPLPPNHAEFYRHKSAAAGAAPAGAAPAAEPAAVNSGAASESAPPSATR